MPIYEYVCRACSHELEIIQSIKESPLTECPSCSKITLRKKLSAAAFHLKGTGWYETDFKNKADKKKDKSNQSTTDASSEKGESGSDKKSSDSKTTTADSASSSGATAA